MHFISKCVTFGQVIVYCGRAVLHLNNSFFVVLICLLDGFVYVCRCMDALHRLF